VKAAKADIVRRHGTRIASSARSGRRAASAVTAEAVQPSLF
jgi:hypothetical protein